MKRLSSPSSSSQLVFGLDVRVVFCRTGRCGPRPVPRIWAVPLRPPATARARPAADSASLLLFEKAHLAVEQRRLVPRRAEKERRRIGAGGHRIENRVPDLGGDVLGLVGDEQQAGGLAARIGIGIGGDEADGCLAEFDDGAIPRLNVPGQQVPQPGDEAIARDRGLRPDGRRGDDDFATGLGVGMNTQQSICASISSLPDWRAKTTANCKPRSFVMLRAMASAGSRWYARNLCDGMLLSNIPVTDFR